MIDIVLSNKSTVSLNSLKFGIIQNNNEIIVLDDIDCNNKNEFHFAVGYNQDTEFFFEYRLENEEDNKIYKFNLNDLTNVEQPQRKIFEINDKKEIIEIE